MVSSLYYSLISLHSRYESSLLLWRSSRCARAASGGGLRRRRDMRLMVNAQRFPLFVVQQNVRPTLAHMGDSLFGRPFITLKVIYTHTKYKTKITKHYDQCDEPLPASNSSRQALRCAFGRPCNGRTRCHQQVWSSSATRSLNCAQLDVP